MSRATQTESSQEQQERSELKEAYHRLTVAWNRFEQAQREAARRGANPDTDRTVIETHDHLHSAVMTLYNQLRSQIRYQLPEFWTDVDVYRHPETGEVLIEGLKTLEKFRGKVQETSETVENRYGPDTVESYYEPVLLPPKACQRTMDLLSDAMLELGYIQPPKKRSHVSVLQAHPDKDEGDADE